MNESVDLSPLETDALVEILNMGMGQAGNSLGQLVRDEVTLSVPELSLCSVDEVMATLNQLDDDKIEYVAQEISGGIEGQAILIVADELSVKLLNICLRAQKPGEDHEVLRQDTILEIGNIIISACVSSLANNLGLVVRPGTPSYHCDHGSVRFAQAGQKRSVIFVSIDFQLPSQNNVDTIKFSFAIDSLVGIKQGLHRFLGKLA